MTPSDTGESGSGSLSWSSARFQLGERIAHRYRVYDLLGRGAMGEVYEVLDLELGERVALKMLHLQVQGDGEGAARFRREVRLARRISHRNVCHLYDLGIHRPRGELECLFLTMERLEGETLAQRLRRVGRFDEEQALELLRQLAAGLAAAHEAGVVHRDLKTSNVFLVPEADGERVVITDFGLARASDRLDETATVTHTGQIIGSPAYMAPEQVRGEVVSPATDVYALGVMLYEVLIGSRPFEAATAVRTLVQRLQEPAPPILERRPELAPRWAHGVMRCLRRDPKHRFESPLALLAFVEHGSEVSVPSERVVAESGHERPGAGPVPAPTVVATAVGVALAVVVLVGLLWWGARTSQDPEISAPSFVESEGVAMAAVPPVGAATAWEELAHLDPAAANRRVQGEGPTASFWWRWVGIEARRQLGQGAEAQQSFRELERADGVQRQLPPSLLGALDARLGHRPAEAAAHYQRWVEGSPGAEPFAYPLALMAAVEAGDLERADTLIRQRVASAARGDSVAPSELLWGRLEVAAARGHWLEAERHGDALLALEELPPMQRARGLTLRGAARLGQHRTEEALEDVEAARAAFSAVEHDLAATEALVLSLQALEFLGRGEESLELITSALQRLENLEAPAAGAALRKAYGDWLYHRSDLERAREHYAEARRLARWGRQPRLEGRAVIGLANLATLEGDPDAAVALYRESLASFEACGDEAGQAATWHHIGRSQLQQQQLNEAGQSYRRSGRLARRTGNLRLEYYGLRGEAQARRAQGDFTAAAERLSTALRLPLEDPRYRAWLRLESANLARHQGKVTDALAHGQAAQEALGAVFEPWARLGIETELAFARLFRGEMAGFQLHREAVARLALEVDHPQARATLALLDAHGALEQEGPAAAQAHFEAAVRIYEQQAQSLEAAQCRGWAAFAAAMAGRREVAEEHAATARGIFEDEASSASDRAFWLFVQGRLAEARGEGKAARRLYGEARVQQLALGEDLVAARSLYEQARVAAAQEDAAEARRLATLAAADFDRCGATGWARRARGLLAGL